MPAWIAAAAVLRGSASPGGRLTSLRREGSRPSSGLDGYNGWSVSWKTLAGVSAVTW